MLKPTDAEVKIDSCGGGPCGGRRPHPSAGQTGRYGSYLRGLRRAPPQAIMI